MRVTSDRYRSQTRNKEDAAARLRALVALALRRPKPRKKTSPSQGAIERRLKDKKEQGEKKRRRRPPTADE